MGAEDIKRKLTAILSADVKDYSRLMSQDEVGTIKTLKSYRELISSFIQQYKGRIIDTPGDNILAAFGSVSNAVNCAVEIQRELAERNAQIPSMRMMQWRIGINLGDVVEDDDRIYGDGVNIAARIEALAEPGGISVSGTVYDHVKNKLGLEYEYLGEHSVKNIKDPVRVYRVLMEPEAAGKIIGENKPTGRTYLKIAMAAIIILIIIAAGLTGWIIHSQQSRKIEQASIEPEQAPVVEDVEEGPKTIAVLPFINLSPEKDQEYFVDGLSEEILNSLAQLPDLTVIARTSSFSFKGSNKKVQEIANELGVENLLEGSVRKAGNALRVTAQLVSGVDGSQLWSKNYDRELKDIFAVQEDIATSVADELKIKLGIGRTLKQLGGTENIKAYELYLKAKGKRSEHNISGFKGAIALLDAAIVLDPEFALAWAYKACNHHLLNEFLPAKLSIMEGDAALSAAQKAIELEPNLADGYVYLGNIKYGQSKLIQAELNYRKALELIGETLSGDDHFIVRFYLGVGKFKRAHELLERMRRNDPINQAFLAWYYYTYGLLGDRQRAEEEYQRRNKLLLKGYSGWHDDAITQVRLGSGDALSTDEIVSSDPISITLKEYLDSPEAGIVELRRIYSSDDNLSAWDLNFISVWSAYFGDSELAMEIMENTGLARSIFFPINREFRKTPRFKEFVREIGLVDYWKEFGWPDTNICRPVGDDDFECD